MNLFLNSGGIRRVLQVDFKVKILEKLKIIITQFFVWG